jgi:hypothetical protein
MGHILSALDAICRVPDSFRAAGNKSFVELVREAGLDPGASLGAHELVPLLKSNPALIKSWMRWSADKRVSSGWYFVSEGALFVVGYYPWRDRQVFEDPAHACAEFIIKETERARALMLVTSAH